MHLEIEASEELKDTIKCFWYDSREYGETQSGFEAIPDGYAEIIFYFGSSCSILSNGKLKLLPSPFMVGLLNQPVAFYSQNKLEIIAIRCFPWTVFDLLGLPSAKGELHTFEHPIAQLQAPLNNFIQEGKIDEALAYVKQYFIDAVAETPADGMLRKAGTAMKNAKGALPVSQIAEAAHVTVRTLERNFKQSSGHTVKDVSGLMRFEQVRNYLWHHPEINLVALAHDLGYTDQSHLSREFKRYSGTTPVAFARRAKVGKRVLSDDFVAFVQS